MQADSSTTKTQGGLGIGLTLVKSLAEMHGGSVTAASEGLGKGSEFVLRLPLSSGTMPRSNVEKGVEHERRCDPSLQRLLVVDDNHDAADSLAMLLKLRKYEVRVAHDGRSALEVSASFRPDLTFLDIGMPGLDGYQVARILRTTPGLAKTVLVALTGWGQLEDRRKSKEAGFDHHLTKPVDLAHLESLLAGLPEREH